MNKFAAHYIQSLEKLGAPLLRGAPALRTDVGDQDLRITNDQDGSIIGRANDYKYNNQINNTLKPNIKGWHRFPGNSYQTQEIFKTIRPGLAQIGSMAQTGGLSRTPPNTVVMSHIHGGGDKGEYGIFNAEDPKNPAVYTQTRSGNLSLGAQHLIPKEVLNSKPKHVVSNACNSQGGGCPQFYANIFGPQVETVSMTPPGKIGIAGTTAMNVLDPIIRRSFPKSSPLHTYERGAAKPIPNFKGVEGRLTVGHDWIDKGEYQTPLGNKARAVGTAIRNAGNKITSALQMTPISASPLF